MGISVPIGAGAISGSINASSAKVNGRYANVEQQSGIQAGDDGFQIQVAGNTDLKGGVIASSAQAAANDKNRLSTSTLTTSDIANSNTFQASSVGIGISMSGPSGTGGTNNQGTSKVGAGLTGTSVGMGSASGNDSSTTRSGVSNAVISITDDAAQQARTGKDADTTIASLNRNVVSGQDSTIGAPLKKIWNGQQLLQDVTAQTQITAAFGQAAAKTIGDVADKKRDEAKARGDTEAEKNWDEGGSYRVALHAAAGALAGGVQGAAGAVTSAKAMPTLGKMIDDIDAPQAVKQALAQVGAAMLGSAVGGTAGLASAVNVEANNRQLHQSERDWAKKNAKEFARYYEEKTGRIISAERAEQMLLGDGYRLVDDSASKGLGVAGPTADAVAVSFIAQNAGNLFKATFEERRNPGPLGGPLTPEQAALPGAVGNPMLGLAALGTVTGGAALAGVGTGVMIAGVVDAWTAYRAASAAYSMGAALGTGMAVGGVSYTGGAGGSAVYDRIFGSGQAISAGFDQRFSYPGLAAATTVGGLTGMYSTAMFGWAGISNSFTNWATIPGVIIRINSGVFGKLAGGAVQRAVQSSNNR